MRPFRTRRLTSGERTLAAEMFGAALDPRRVRILALPLWPRAFVAGPGLIVWPVRAAAVDFTDQALRLQAVFVHELTHVWQAQAGVFLPWAKLRAGDSHAAYAYDLERGPAFAALNIEQQAMVVEHAFLASRGAAVQHAAEAYAEARKTWMQA